MSIQSIRTKLSDHTRCEVSIKKIVIASMHQEITVQGLAKHLISALLAAADMQVTDKYDAAVIGIKVDGRNEDGERETDAKYMPVAFLDNLTDSDKLKIMEQQFDFFFLSLNIINDLHRECFQWAKGSNGT